jgi:integrase
MYALWRLAVTTGMRRGEVLGLTWRTLDLDGARLDVEQQLVPTRGGATFGPPKSARSRRMIRLDEETVEVLRQHREAQELERLVAGDAYEDADLAFANELGAPIHPQRLTEAFDAHRKAAGLPDGTLHTLRHTHITHLLTIRRPAARRRRASWRPARDDPADLCPPSADPRRGGGKAGRCAHRLSPVFRSARMTRPENGPFPVATAPAR